jgi:hypothetical protein
VSEPTGSDELETAAMPFEIVAVPRFVVPFVNVTVPVAVAGKVAVKVTD